MNLKTLIFSVNLCLLLISVSNVYSQSNDNDPTKWKYFSIYVNTNDDNIFLKLQEDIGISPFLESYLMIANISAENELDWYLVIGDENSPDNLKTKWRDISKEVRDGLIAWSKPNKIKIVK